MRMFAVAVHGRTSLCMKQQLPAQSSFHDNAELARQRSWWGRYGRRDLLKWPRAATAVNYRRECASFFFSLSLFPSPLLSFFTFPRNYFGTIYRYDDVAQSLKGVLWNYSFRFDVAAHNTLIRG